MHGGAIATSAAKFASQGRISGCGCVGGGWREGGGGERLASHNWRTISCPSFSLVGRGLLIIQRRFAPGVFLPVGYLL